MAQQIERPLSPFMTYRWTLTMAMSIVHRATGVALYFGTLLLVWWLLATASGPQAYATFQGFIGSWFGRLILFGYTWALIHHLLGGARGAETAHPAERRANRGFRGAHRRPPTA